MLVESLGSIQHAFLRACLVILQTEIHSSSNSITGDIAKSICINVYFHQQATDKHVNQSYCPSVIKAEEKPTFMDNKKIFYLPVHDSIDIVIKGRNLIEVSILLSYL